MPLSDDDPRRWISLAASTGAVPCVACKGRGWIRLPVSSHWSSGAIDDCMECMGVGHHDRDEDDIRPDPGCHTDEG